MINSKKGGRPQKWYNLDAIISIGYRINSKEATQFRRWANKILKEYMVKGFVIDKELLKKGGRFTEDYFDELLETIREIGLQREDSIKKSQTFMQQALIITKMQT